MIELFKAILFGIVEGITEWLPVSSTGHMILLNEFVQLKVSPAFWELFLVLIQVGAIMAVVVLFWNRLFPFQFRGGFAIDKPKIAMWVKIAFTCLPAAVVGILWDDLFNKLFYNYQTVAIMLIVFGILFILVERHNAGRSPRVTSIRNITYKAALIIGLFQTLSAVFPGTSRSGAIIIAALLLGISRTTAAEFSFFLAIPAMIGGSFIRLIKFEGSVTSNEVVLMVVGMVVAFVVSLFCIKLLMEYIRKHDFKVFGWYRIVLGLVMLGYFLLAK